MISPNQVRYAIQSINTIWVLRELRRAKTSELVDAILVHVVETLHWLRRIGTPVLVSMPAKVPASIKMHLVVPVLQYGTA